VFTHRWPGKTNRYGILKSSMAASEFSTKRSMREQLQIQEFENDVWDRFRRCIDTLLWCHWRSWGSPVNMGISHNYAHYIRSANPSMLGYVFKKRQSLRRIVGQFRRHPAGLKSFKKRAWKAHAPAKAAPLQRGIQSKVLDVCRGPLKRPQGPLKGTREPSRFPARARPFTATALNGARMIFNI